DDLDAVLGDDRDVLEPDAAPAAAVETGLEGDHVAGDEVVADAAERRALVHLEPDAVAERMEEAVLEHLSRRLRPLRRVTVLLEELAGDVEERAAVHARLRGRDDTVERLLAERVPLAQVRMYVADDVGAGHIGVHAALAVARGEVERHGLARQDRAVPSLVAYRRLRAVRDDELVGVGAVLAEDALELDLDPLGRERRTLEHEGPVHGRAAQQLAADVERRLGGALRTSEAGDLGGRLAPAALGEVIAVGLDLHARAPQPVGELERERRRHGRAGDPELTAGVRVDVQLHLAARRAAGEQVVDAERLERDHLERRIPFADALRLERGDDDRATAL